MKELLPKLSSSNYSVKIILLILAVLYSLSFYSLKQPYCWDWDMDMYYYFNHSQFYTEDVLNSLTLFVSYLWARLWGHDMTMFRLLGWLCSILSIALPYYILQNKEGRKNNLHFLALGIWLFGYGTWAMFNNDSLSLLCLSVLTALTIKFDAGKIVNVLILSAVTALAVAARFPNIVVLFPIILYIALRPQKMSWQIYPTVLYIAFFLLFYVCIIALLTGDINILALLRRNVAGGLEGPHTPVALAKVYIASFCRSIIPFALILTYLWAVRKTKLTEKSVLWTVIATMLLCMATLLLCYKFWWNYWPVYSYSIITLLLFKAYKTRESKGFLPYLLIAVMTVVPIAGSDTGMMKLFLLSSAFSPIIFIDVREFLGSNMAKGIIVLAILFSTLFYNKDLFFYNRENPSPEIKGYMDDFKKCGMKDKTIFFGHSKVSHEMYFREDTALPYNCSFWQRTDAEAQKVIEMMRADKELVLFDFSGREEIRDALLAESYSIVKETDKVTIYKYQ